MTQLKLILSGLAVTAVLAGCMPAPAPMPAPVPATLPPVAPPPVAGTAFQEHEPDLCNAANYTQYLSQPGSIIPTLGLTGDYRVVEYRGIEPQEYNAKRLVFRLDAAGIIQNIDCG